MERLFAVCCALLVLGGCAQSVCGDGLVDGPETCDDANEVVGDGCSACRADVGTGLADEAVDAPGATGSGFGDPTRAIDGVRGGGATMQSVNVYSIALTDDYLVLGFSGRALLDGPGADLAVFENPFSYGDGLTFIDAAIVEVSADGERWIELPHDYVAADERVYSARIDDWVGFAGVHPVFLHAENNPVDPFGPDAGGDVFDLAALPESADADRIRGEGARYVRIASASSRLNPDTGERFVMDPTSNGADIDGVYARYLVEGP
jgi:cysteine-rich repeat protein